MRSARARDEINKTTVTSVSRRARFVSSDLAVSFVAKAKDEARRVRTGALADARAKMRDATRLAIARDRALAHHIAVAAAAAVSKSKWTRGGDGGSSRGESAVARLNASARIRRACVVAGCDGRIRARARAQRVCLRKNSCRRRNKDAI